ncbi:MAG TPA: aminoacyl-tRNA hydrolase [Ornithinimicrobium sp.]|uniref:aminoacyl-tRNA hydrolase n=1 Tax=Ornithinimicrobium sp. TaxID=1977084 RepID=UPI002B4A32D5|nr:aminoacyl-tRNA hydrolase [Ornithinimicrobium sp.]HKJ12867.1 aminoacyl-tRNA hydrolase [Ornithinimicrobium sp.]
MEPWLVVGLGNPGPAYAGHRHNIGARCVGALAAEHHEKLTKDRTRSLVGRVRLGTLPGGRPGPAALLAVPQTFMNLSGGPVASLARYYSVPVEHIAVIHDELDLDFGTVRLKRGGGEGGHNGLRSVSSALGTKEYLRVRLGVGRPPGRQDPADYVLSSFPARDAAEVDLLVGDGAEAVTELIHHGLQAAQQRFHPRGPASRS